MLTNTFHTDLKSWSYWSRTWTIFLPSQSYSVLLVSSQQVWRNNHTIRFFLFWDKLASSESLLVKQAVWFCLSPPPPLGQGLTLVTSVIEGDYTELKAEAAAARQVMSHCIVGLLVSVTFIHTHHISTVYLLYVRAYHVLYIHVWMWPACNAYIRTYNTCITTHIRTCLLILCECHFPVRIQTLKNVCNDYKIQGFCEVAICSKVLDGLSVAWVYRLCSGASDFYFL